VSGFLTLIWLFVYNLQIPFTVLSVVGILTAAFYITGANVEIHLSNYNSDQDREARWTRLMSLQCGIILAVLTTFLWAIPSPTYDIKTVTVTKTVQPVVVRTITKTITKPSTYNAAYLLCINSIARGLDSKEVAMCHSNAIQATHPDRLVMVKTVIKDNTYLDILTKCYDSTIKYDNRHGERLAAASNCRTTALDGIQKVPPPFRTKAIASPVK
jgi:hypothetical protein